MDDFSNAGVLAVQFGDGRRPEAATRVRLPTFDGPLGLLLALIEARELDVLSVPLGALAEAYLDALAALDDDRLGNVSAFVAIASQLILIKSKALLPRREDAPPSSLPDEGPDPEAELRARLLLYRAYRDAGAALQMLALERVGLFSRDPGATLASAIAGARPASVAPLDSTLLARAIEELLRVVPLPEPPPESLPRTMTIEERAVAIRAALDEAVRSGAGVVVLQELLRGVRDRVVVALTFLAMLELVKRRQIVVEQAEPWGPIVARPATVLDVSPNGHRPDGRAGPARAAFGADRPVDAERESDR